MLNNSAIVQVDSWLEISNNEAFVLQNKGTEDILVIASDTIPTNRDNAVVLKSKESITEEVISGRIWAIASTRTNQ